MLFIFHGGCMNLRWPDKIIFREKLLQVEEKNCRICGSVLRNRSIRIHRINTFNGPVKLICRLAQCSNQHCLHHTQLISPETENAITMPHWTIDWELFLWIGYRRYKRDWSIPQILYELQDSYQISISENRFARYLKKYEIMVASRHSDLNLWKEEYSDCRDVILSIDGLQPEKGHETVYVVRELRKNRVWFAEILISSSNDEIRKLIQSAKSLAKQLDKKIIGWVSDKQDAFVTMIAQECRGTPHRYCKNHFLRDLAEEVSSLDSTAKVQMRRKVRGLREIEKSLLSELEMAKSRSDPPYTPEQLGNSAQIVFDYCSAIRGILNNNRGGPLEPAGMKMAFALEEFDESIQWCLNHKETTISPKLKQLSGCIQRGLSIYNEDKERIQNYMSQINKVNTTLKIGDGWVQNRSLKFNRLRLNFEKSDDIIENNMAKLMKRFKPGLFLGRHDKKIPDDNLDLERWFRNPKGHERRIHGHKHAGTRIIRDGSTLLLALDAHLFRSEPFTHNDLMPYINAVPPENQQQAMHRSQVMTKATSKKKDHF